MAMKRLVMGLLILGLFLAGCTDGDDEDTKDGVFFGGVEGVSIEFVDIAPPTQFDQDDSVSVKAVLSNKGEFDITAGNAVARLFGLSLDNFGLDSSYVPTEGGLRGKSELSIEGGQQEVDFGNLEYSLPVVNSQDFTLRARVCYPYQTEALVDVCLKSSLAAEAGDSICDISGEKVTTSSISSAPIKITSITERARGSDQIRFDVTIENQGSGEVFSPDSVCADLDDPLTKREQEDRIMFEVVNPLGVECDFRKGDPSNKGEIELNAGQEVLTCWKSVEDTVEDKLNIKLNYIYRDATSTQITIFESTS